MISCLDQQGIVPFSGKVIRVKLGVSCEINHNQLQSQIICSVLWTKEKKERLEEEMIVGHKEPKWLGRREERMAGSAVEDVELGQ